ncbi:uncharacterized protein A4U43_C01F19360 [Asparagus officinalis]|uniref:Pentacotripeptide-repeat region of PRORP domain-containing protein n=1 Tax=Asparagus officinalis TaxID=4686 RepID=A0A5P1FQL3_ASPOF|nr:pentatricopeptide repeat-containing protein At4g02820, mitochondrial [Asparagus officinalis]ONK80576.1 uncharacterized protein A4U43_C01F19360 [Asparagus officinalis]
MLLARLFRRCALLSARAQPLSSSATAEFLTSHQSTTPTTTYNSSGKGRDTLGRRLLSLIYPKRSAVIVLRKWAEEGKPIQKYQLNRVVRELRIYKRYKHALEICEWMRTQPDFKLLPGDFAVHLDLVAKVRGLSSAEKFYEDLPEKMKGQSTCSALLHTYVQNKMSTKAEELMKQMSIHGLLRCALPYNHMISLYISTDATDKVGEMVKELKKNTSPNELTYNLWLTACANINDTNTAEKIFEEMKERRLAPDWVTYSILTSIYIKSGKISAAKEALKEMEKRVSRKERTGYCSLISLYANLSDKENVYRIWDKMRMTFRKMSDVEYKCMLSSLAKLGEIEEAESIYNQWESVSGTGDSRVPNILLAFYVKHRMMLKAESLHARILRAGIEPSYSTWELLAWGYLREERMNKVFDCLKRGLLSLEKWEPDIRIVRGVFDKLEKLGNVEDAEEFLVMLRGVGYVTTEIYNSLLRTYAKACKMPLIVAERMRADNVELDGETRRLLKETSRFCVATSVSTLIS